MTFGSPAIRRSIILSVCLALTIGCGNKSDPRQTVSTVQKESLMSKQVTNSIGMKFVQILAGKFLMGFPADEYDLQSYEQPEREVEISRPFYLGIFEVTQSEYERVAGTNPAAFSLHDDNKDKVSGMDTTRFPVENVSWHDAVEFCSKLSSLPKEKQAGRSYRLPTEAEWEYACRAGSRTRFHWGNSLSSHQANIDGTKGQWGAEDGPYLEKPTPVGSYQPNAWGLYDMHGNVYEWCLDWDSYEKSSIKDPQGPSKGQYKLLRGGSWQGNARWARSAFRPWNPPHSRTETDGFRVVMMAADVQ